MELQITEIQTATDEPQTTTKTRTKKTADMKTYMREYMKKRYQDNPEQEKAYRMSYLAKKKANVDEEEFRKYGLHLANVLKLRNLIKKIPKEFLVEELTQFI